MPSAWLGTLLEHRAIDHDTSLKTTDRSAILDRCDIKADFITALERILAPACGVLGDCTLRLYDPMQRVAAVVVRVDL